MMHELRPELWEEEKAVGNTLKLKSNEKFDFFLLIIYINC